MSEIDLTTTDPEIAAVLRRLKRRIRRYLLIEGAATLVVVLAGLFWLSVVVDVAYFEISLFDLPKWFRLSFDVATAAMAAGTLLFFLTILLTRRLHAKALALVLERRFPELNDGLVTAVELNRSTEGAGTPLADAMLNRTVRQTIETIDRVDIGGVFDRKPLRRVSIVAVTLLMAIVIFAVINPEAVARWTAGFVKLTPEYWDRECNLVVTALAQPGDIKRPFLSFQDRHHYKHPRGDDLVILATVPEGKRVPERVQVRYQLTDSGGMGRATCSKTGPRQFQFALSGLLNSLDFWVIGGDYANRKPYHVEVVPPPQIDSLVLASRYPDYTRLNAPNASDSDQPVRDLVSVLSSQVDLPMETQFDMVGHVNKPLRGALIQTELFELWVGTQGVLSGLDESRGDEHAAVRAAVTIKSEDGKSLWRCTIPPSQASGLIPDDRLGFSVPFVLATDAIQRLKDAGYQHAISAGAAWPFPLAAGQRLRIYLEDSDGIVAAEPARVTVQGIVDQPPVIETHLMAIGTSITRKATIPIAGTITDDYGISRARFDYRIDANELWTPRSLKTPPAGTPVRHELKIGAKKPFERFDVLPLGLSEGQELTVAVYAEDGDNMNGPHNSHGQRYRFKIVSNAAMLSILYQKELNLRRRFEQIIADAKTTRQDLVLHRTRLEEHETSGTPPKDDTPPNEIHIAVTACAERSLHAMQKSANETLSVEHDFVDMRDELVNNGIQTPQMLERIENAIIDPLHSVTTHDYPRIDQELGSFKTACDGDADPSPAISTSVARIDAMIGRMESILKEMRKLETFQEALELLKGIIDEEESLHAETKKEQKRKDLNKLKGLSLP